MNISSADLNLLLAFEAIWLEKSVSGAARRIGVGQPAMSNALSRLRVMFSDPLFVRQGRGVIPTPRAIQLLEPINRALSAVREALEPVAPFNPSTATRTFCVSGGDYALMTLLPLIVAEVRAQAPQIDIRFRFVEKDRIPELLDHGSLDVALGVFPDCPKRFEIVHLFSERFMVLTHRKSPDTKQTLTAARYAGLPHVLVTERGDESGVVDVELAKQALSRRIVLTVPSFLVLKRMLIDTDLVATIGERIAKLLASDGRLKIVSPPIELKSWTMTLMRPRRKAADPGIQWLTDLFVTAGRAS